MQDAACGKIIFVVTGVLFTYYSAWLMLTVRHAQITHTHTSHHIIVSTFAHRLCRCLTALLSVCVWLQPFIEEGQPFLKLFPPLEYALLLPSTVLVVTAAVVLAYTGLVLLTA